MKIFLDDVRQPEHCVHYMHKRIGHLNPMYIDEKWVIARNYDEFCRLIKDNYKEITHVSFDHDLGEDEALMAIERGHSKRYARKKIKKNVKSGYDCAVFLKEFYRINKLERPMMFVHSMNPVGTENIINLFK